jgi:hypothetical protein
VQEVGSITQLKAVFPKVFNKKVTWHAGDRLQELFAYEFRKIKEALKAPGTIQQLYRNKVGFGGYGVIAMCVCWLPGFCWVFGSF